MVRFNAIVSLVLVITFMLALPGCSGQKEQAQSTGTEATVKSEATGNATGNMDETLDVTWWGFNVSGYMPVDGSEIEKTLEERFNININNVMADNYNSEQINVLLASGLEFDICTNNQDFAKIEDLGLIRSIPEEYITTYLPAQYSELVNKYGDNWRIYSSIDDKIYGIPVINEAHTAPISMGIRTDWLETIGYSKDTLPKTLDELEKMLLKLHTDDPDRNGKDDTYALNNFDDYSAYVLGAYGVSNRYWYNNKDGSPTYYAIDTNYKDALKVLQRWYKSGIYDPEVVTDVRKDTAAKFLAGKVAGYYGIDWAFTTGHNSSPLKAAKDAGLDIKMTIIPPVTGPTGVTATSKYAAGVSTAGMVFGRNCTDEKLIRLLQVVNTIYSEEDLFKYCMYGPKDVTYVEDEEGYVKTTEKYTNENISTYGAQRYINFGFSPASVLKWRTPRDRLEMFYELDDFPKVESSSISVFMTKAELEYNAATDKIAKEFFWKAFTGEIDVDAEWENYVSSWLKAGGQEILDAKIKLVDSLN